MASGLLKLLVVKWLQFSVAVRVRVRGRNREWFHSFFFEHNHILSGKKTVTGVQVITASQDWHNPASNNKHSHGVE